MQAADKIEMYVKEAGEPWELLQKLRASDYPLAADEEAKAALKEMETLFTLLGNMGKALTSIRRVLFSLFTSVTVPTLQSMERAFPIQAS